MQERKPKYKISTEFIEPAKAKILKCIRLKLLIFLKNQSQ